jgi:nitroimidazol reductase NimA-like FMN-containing flavoprotein (pyridoxamine 5'-phosphate oxidase superfamily)
LAEHPGSQPPDPVAEPLDAPADYPFPRSQTGLLAWPVIEERLMQAPNYWLATVRPDGRPHVAPLWGVWVDRALYFDGSPATRWARNLAANPAAAVNLESGYDAVILEGVVEDVVTDEALAARILAAWEGKYGRLPPEPATRGMFRFRPRVARAWSESLADGTRWRFAQS